MAEKSGFFDANLVNGVYDRTYLADSFAKYFASFIGNGVFGDKLNELIVTQAATAGMKIEVSSGMGWINGYWYENTSNLSLNIDVADGILNRIDCIVLRWSKSDRSINVVVKKGTFASNPTTPTLQRDADVYELKLAEINVNAGITSIAQANIKDTRLDTNDCGFVTSLIEQIDTTEFAELFNSTLKSLEAKTKDLIMFMVNKLGDVVEDENAFASLVLKVNDIISETALSKQTLGYDKKNMIPHPYVHTTRTANGITWTDIGDGTIRVNGVAVGNSYFTLYSGECFAPGKYIVSSEADVNGKHYIYIRYLDKITGDNVGTSVYGYGDVPFEIKNEDIEKYKLFIGLYVVSGENISNLLFKPMLRRAEIIDGTWEPYKLSVKETQDIVKETQSTVKEMQNTIATINDKTSGYNTPLWGGILSSGSTITCPNVNNYNIFVVQMQNFTATETHNAICYKDPLSLKIEGAVIVSGTTWGCVLNTSLNNEVKCVSAYVIYDGQKGDADIINIIGIM